MELYYSSNIGNTLIESLNEMILLKIITNEIAQEILNNYKNLFLESFQREINKTSISKIIIKGDINNYNNLNYMWRFDLENVQMELSGIIHDISNCRVVIDKELK